MLEGGRKLKGELDDESKCLLVTARLASRGDKTAIELFLAGVQTLQSAIWRVFQIVALAPACTAAFTFSMNTGQRGSDSKLMSSMKPRPTGNHARRNSRSTNACSSAAKARSLSPRAA